MKKIFTSILCLCLLITAAAQQYPVGKRTVTFLDANRGNRGIQTDLYYPGATAGNNVAIAAGTDSFPVIVFGHGFLIGTDSYTWLADSLVRNGYIVALPATEGGILPSHAAFGADLAFLCGYVTSLNDSAASFLYNRVMKKAAVGGHSMGGGASFLAASGVKPAINVLFNFAAAETNPSATAAATGVTKPAIIFSGSGDCIAPASVQQGMYNNIAVCKTYINITDALHCQFANNNFTCGLGQVTTGCNNSSITPSVVFTKTIALLLPFFDYYLKAICTKGDDFVAAYTNATGVTKQRSCAALPACGILPVTLIDFTAVALNDKVQVQWRTAAELNVQSFFIERSSDGIDFKALSSSAPKANAGAGAAYSVTDNYPFAGVGYYRLRTTDVNGRISYSAVSKVSLVKKTVVVTGIYPNPVATGLMVQVQSDRYQQVVFSVSDMSGKKLFTENKMLLTGVNEALIDCTKLAAGGYFLHAKLQDGSLIGNYKIIKK